ncbi:MAG: HAMP domain-containing sensor histidine kinase [Methylotenera sp.]|nr:HAMP domain-containing sensor histidine kinase [Methylotenera sp.]
MQTKLKAYELERRQLEGSLLASTTRLKETQRIARIGSWALDLLNSELIWSDEIFHLFEIDPTQFSANYEGFLNTIHPLDRDAVNQAYTESLANRTPYDITHRLLMSDGRIKWVHERGMSDYDASGKPLRSQGTVQDITEFKVTENLLRESESKYRLIARQELNHRLEQSQFMAMLTHELITPLATIKLAVSTLGGNKSNDVDQVSLGHIGLAVRDMDAIIDRCIQADKVDQGVLHINTSRFLLAPCVNDIARNLGALTRLDTDIPASMSITSDDMMFRLIVSNLLENAFKYSPPESKVNMYATLQLSETNQSGVLIRICNEVGKAGRPDEARVFERYYRSSAAQRQRGTGLGLWLVKCISARLGGQAGYVSLHDKAEFQVWLPQ